MSGIMTSTHQRLPYAYLIDDSSPREESSRHPLGRFVSNHSQPLGGERTLIDIPPSLVARIRQKDEAAFEEMLSIAYVPLLRVSQAFLRSPDDVKDVVQDVLVKVWSLGDNWNPTGSPIAYLLASVRNQAIKVRKTLERF